MPDNTEQVEKVESTSTLDSASAGASAKGDTKGASPTSETSDNGLPKGLLEHLEKSVPGLQASEDVEQAGVDEAPAEDGQTQEVEGQEPKADATDTNEQQTEQTDTDKGPVPYERFHTINEAKNKLEAQLKDQEEYVKAQNVLVDFCDQNRISIEKFQYWMNVAAAAENNPEALSELLKPYIEQTQTLKGEILPADLQAAVDAGEISLPMAKRIAKAEGQTKFASQRVQQSQEQLKAQAQQKFVNEIQTSYFNWIKEKQKSDPDFKPKASDSEPDGKFEFVQYKMGSEYSKAGLKDAASLLSFAEKVYESVSKSFGRSTPKPNGQKVVRTNSSTSVVPPTEPRNHLEAVMMGAKAATMRRG